MSHDDPDDGGDPSGDLEVEVAPLSTSRRPWDASVPPNPLFATVRSRQTRRRGIAVASVLALAVAVLIFSITPTREALRGVVFGPTAPTTAPITAGEDHLYVTIAPNWGSVSLDGHRLRTLPVVGVDQPLHLSRGTHTLRWSFAPIIDYSCRLTVPFAVGDDCPLLIGLLPSNKGIATVVGLRLSIETLAMQAYRDSLTKAVMIALMEQKSSTTVYPGERYVRGEAGAGEIVTATQPLRATLSFIADIGNVLATCQGIQSGPGADCMMIGDCRAICAAPWQTPPSSPTSEWQAYVTGHASWLYTSLDMRFLADNQPDTGGQFAYLGHAEMPIPITIAWDGANWHVTTTFGIESSSPLPDPVCGTLWAEFQSQQIAAPPSSAGWQASTVQYIPATSPAEGCLAVITTPDQPTLLYLQRFGVPLTANAAAQSWSGYLPRADTYERQLAQRIYAASLRGATGG